MKKILSLCLVAVLSITVLLLAACGIQKDPVNYLHSSISKTMDKWEVSELTKLSEKLSKSASLSVSLDPDAMLSYYMPDLFPVNLNLYYGDSSTVLTASAYLNGRKTALDVFLSEKNVILNSEVLLGDKAYGVDLKNFEKNYADSIFSEDSGSEYSMPGVFEGLNEQLDSMSELPELMEKISKSKDVYIDMFKSAVRSHSEITEEASKDGKIINIRLSSADIAEIIEELDKEYGEDKNIAAFYDIVSSVSGLYGDETVADAREDIKDVCDMLKECDENTNYVFVSFDIGSDGIIDSFEMSAYADAELGAKIIVELDDDSITVRCEYEGDVYIATLEINENTEKKLDVSLNVKYGQSSSATTVFAAAFEYDRTSGDYELSGYGFALNGNLVYSDKKIALSVESISISGDEVDLGLEITLDTTQKMPSAPKKFNEITDLTEEEFEAIIENVITCFAQLGI